MPLSLIFYLRHSRRSAAAAAPSRCLRAESLRWLRGSGELPAAAAAAPQRSYATGHSSSGSTDSRRPAPHAPSRDAPEPPRARAAEPFSGLLPARTGGEADRATAPPTAARRGPCRGARCAASSPPSPPARRGTHLPAPEASVAPLRDAASLPETLPGPCAYPGNDSGRRPPPPPPLLLSSAPAAAQSRGPQGAGRAERGEAGAGAAMLCARCGAGAPGAALGLAPAGPGLRPLSALPCGAVGLLISIQSVASRADVLPSRGKGGVCRQVYPSKTGAHLRISLLFWSFLRENRRVRLALGTCNNALTEVRQEQ